MTYPHQFTMRMVSTFTMRIGHDDDDDGGMKTVHWYFLPICMYSTIFAYMCVKVKLPLPGLCSPI